MKRGDGHLFETVLLGCPQTPAPASRIAEAVDTCLLNQLWTLLFIALHKVKDNSKLSHADYFSSVAGL